jgi:hypothetical protein
LSTGSAWGAVGGVSAVVVEAAGVSSPYFGVLAAEASSP